MKLRINFGSHPVIKRVLQLSGDQAMVKVQFDDGYVTIAEYSVREVEPADRDVPYNIEMIRSELEKRAEVVHA